MPADATSANCADDGALISARDTCRAALIRRAHDDSRLLCLDSDMGGLKAGFGAVLPGQYLDIGIAEANMLSIAAGLARGGCRPVTHTMATFAAGRACEQMKLDIALHDLPVVIVATHGGFSAGHYGPSHFCLEDFAILRSLPNMTVIAPCDAYEAELALCAALSLQHPVYIRLGRKPTRILQRAQYEFRIGQSQLMRRGQDLTVIAAGPYAVAGALQAADCLKDEIALRVINMPTIKPIDRRAVIEAARETRGIITVEEHSTAGGLGSAVAEVVTTFSPCAVFRIGVANTIPSHVGDEESLLAECGISSAGIVRAARQMHTGELRDGMGWEAGLA
ncbi:transketolase family protein [Consotaella aegiceratis]|uniref:transketolase family protein n=1 Tax=Consotaella aegiceratis TaxID=3097961 RepID=UPI002F3FC550